MFLKQDLRLCKWRTHTWEREVENGPYVEKVREGTGWFHTWSIDYQEFESGPAMYPIAIVELGDGTIVKPLAQDIQFCKM